MRTITTYGPKSADEPIAFAIQDSEGNRKRGARLFFDMKTPDGDEVLSEVPFEWDDDEQTAYLSESFDTSDFPRGVSFGEMDVDVYWSGKGASGTRHLAASTNPVITGGDDIVEFTEDGKQYRSHIFETDGTLEIELQSLRNMEVLVVGGGGGAGGRHGGGGGGGGVLHIQDRIPARKYNVEIGDGGIGGSATVSDDSDLTGPGRVTEGGAQPTDGEDTTFGPETALGGGAGSSYDGDDYLNGFDGGSGGGGPDRDFTYEPGDGIQHDPEVFSGTGYGNDGAENEVDEWGSATGGGGAGEDGSPADEDELIGHGGDGIQINMTGNNYYWAGGGGGSHGDEKNNGLTGGDGGLGGGGGGSSDDDKNGNGSPDKVGKGGGQAYNTGEDGGFTSGEGGPGGDGGANTGGGGGGAGQRPESDTPLPGGEGGSGIVIVKYRV